MKRPKRNNTIYRTECNGPIYNLTDVLKTSKGENDPSEKNINKAKRTNRKKRMLKATLDHQYSIHGNASMAGIQVPLHDPMKN